MVIEGDGRGPRPYGCHDYRQQRRRGIDQGELGASVLLERLRQSMLGARDERAHLVTG
jgi:hypothetical protein